MLPVGKNSISPARSADPLPSRQCSIEASIVHLPLSHTPLTLSFSRFMQAGCSKIYITSRKAKACEEAVAALNALPNKRPGAKAIAIPADFAKVSEIERFAAEVAKTTDHVDILFANAGATWGAPFETHPDSAFSKVMDLNVKSVSILCRNWNL